MKKIILFHSRPTKYGTIPMRTESPDVQLTGRKGRRNCEDWFEVKWYRHKYSLLDIIFNRPASTKIEHVDWYPLSSILIIDN